MRISCTVVRGKCDRESDNQGVQVAPREGSDEHKRLDEAIDLLRRGLGEFSNPVDESLHCLNRRMAHQWYAHVVVHFSVSYENNDSHIFNPNEMLNSYGDMNAQEYVHTTDGEKGRRRNTAGNVKHQLLMEWDRNGGNYEMEVRKIIYSFIRAMCAII